MELTPLLVYESFILIIGLAAVLAFAAFYYRLLKGYNILHREYLELETRTKKESQEVLENSHSQAVQIIRESRVLSSELKEKLAHILEESARREGQAFENILEDAEVDFKRETLSKVDAFAKKLEQGSVSSENAIEKRMDNAYAKVEEEIAAYKNAKLARLDAQIHEIVAQVLTQSTGKVISIQDQEDWIRKALQDAKTTIGF